MKTCPHCGQSVSSAPSELRALIAELPLTGQEVRLAEALIASWPRLVSNDVLVAAMWDHRTDEPKTPEACMYSHVSKLRTKLVPHGWTIASSRFRGRQFKALDADKSTPPPAPLSSAVNQRRAA